MLDYMDSITPGMRAFHQEVEITTQVVDNDWAKAKVGTYGEKVTQDGLSVWRALKALTQGEVRKVVTNVKSESGFRAWQKLHMRFGPSLSAKQGKVLADFSGMIGKPAKTPAETRNLITEMEKDQGD